MSCCQVTTNFSLYKSHLYTFTLYIHIHYNTHLYIISSLLISHTHLISTSSSKKGITKKINFGLYKYFLSGDLTTRNYLLHIIFLLLLLFFMVFICISRGNFSPALSIALYASLFSLKFKKLRTSL